MMKEVHEESLLGRIGREDVECRRACAAYEYDDRWRNACIAYAARQIAGLSRGHNVVRAVVSDFVIKAGSLTCYSTASRDLVRGLALSEQVQCAQTSAPGRSRSSIGELNAQWSLHEGTTRIQPEYTRCVPSEHIIIRLRVPTAADFKTQYAYNARRRRKSFDWRHCLGVRPSPSLGRYLQPRAPAYYLLI